MNPSITKSEILKLYGADKIREAKESLSLRERQLRNCESQLAALHDKVSTLNKVINSNQKADITDAALHEWQRASEDVLKLNGKSAKLHKEITQLRDSIARWTKLRDWSYGS